MVPDAALSRSDRGAAVALSRPSLPGHCRGLRPGCHSRRVQLLPCGGSRDMTVEIGAELLVSLNDGISALNKHNKKREEIVQQVPFASAVPLTAGGGTLDVGGQFEPPRGLIWSVRRLAAVGFTAGTLNVYIDGQEPVAPFAVAGGTYLAPGALLGEAGH